MSASLRVQRLGSLAFLFMLLAALAGCASMPADQRSKRDPWENWNRKVYSFNEKVDETVLKPVATAYTDVVPQPVRQGVTNFFNNVSDLWSAVNNFLQGKVTNGFQDVVRFGTNTVFGLVGIFDVASQFGSERQGEDFGQTLGRWGFGPGPYVVLPLFGPSNLRDAIALPLDRGVTPTLFVGSDLARAGITGVSVINERANLLGASRVLDDVALDKYTFIRDAYLQRRRSLVYDGNPPDEKEEPEEDDDAEPPNPPNQPQSQPPTQPQAAQAAASAASAASAPSPAASAASAPYAPASQASR